MTPDHSSTLAEAWRALDESEAALAAVADQGRPSLASRLRVNDLVRDSVAAASVAAALMAGGETRRVRLDADRVATAVTSDRHFRLDGEKLDAWAPLSGFWQTSDGWVRTHANYAHHRARLLSALALPADTSKQRLAARMTELGAHEVETRVTELDGVAVRVREPEEWTRSAPALAVADGPLIGLSWRDGTTTRPPSVGPAAAPLRGVRVLDLTRVIAGPIATRTLALLGADVLRVDSPRLIEPEWQHLDTGAAKRSTLLDLDDAHGRHRFDDLLHSADVIVLGYRPHSLDRYGLGTDALSARAPGIVVARLSAWGDTGPWASRRGFDSIVQAASGIAVLESKDGAPGALPAQALDHSAGYLLAAGIMSALRRRTERVQSAEVSVSLARVAHTLLNLGAGAGDGAADYSITTATRETAAGAVTSAEPAVSYDGGPATWPAPARRWGGDDAVWTTS